MNPTPAQIIEERKRLFARVTKTPTCWLWQGARQLFGYGVSMAFGKQWYSHRLSWFLGFGAIPKRVRLYHKCPNPHCVRPDHLWLADSPPESARQWLASARRMFSKNVSKTDGCWLWHNRINGRGYGELSLFGRIWLAHRLSWILHRSPIPKDKWVLHRCDVRNCVRPDHLFLGNLLDNNADCTSKGRQPMGERSGAHKLHDQDVRQILSLLRQGFTQRELAKQFGVSSHCTIGRIARGKGWKHIPRARCLLHRPK